MSSNGTNGTNGRPAATGAGRRREIAVGVTGFANLDDPGAGASIAAALRQAGTARLSLTAFGDDPMMTGAWPAGAVDRICLMPGPDHGDEAVFQAIVRAHRAGRLDALIPGTARDALIVARFARRLSDLGIRTLLPGAEQLAAVQPARLIHTLGDADIPLAPAVIVADLADLDWQAGQIGYPLYVRSAAAARLVFDAAQAARAGRRFARAPGRPLVLQRRIDGEKFAVAMVAAADGSCAARVVRRSLALNGEGHTVAGAVVDDPEVARFAQRILARLDWRGPIELTIVRSPGTKGLWLAAVDGRLPSWCMLSHWAGANLAAILLRHILPGRRPARRRPRSGTMSVSGISETGIPLDHLARLRLRGAVARPVNGIDGPRPRPTDEPGAGLRVAVSGISSYDVINPGLGVARSLGRADRVAAVYGLTYGTFDSGAYQPSLFDATFLLPSAGHADRLLARVREIHRDRPFDVLLPCLDGELPAFLEIAPALRKLGVRTLLPSRDALRRRAKLSLFGGRLARDWGGFEIPDSRIARSEAGTAGAVAEVGAAAVVKGPISHCVPVATAAEARQAWRQFATFGQKPVIVQPRIEGSAFAVSAVCDRHHRAVSLLTVRKTAICERGSTWGAVASPEPGLEQAFAAFLKAIKWVGPAEGEFLRDPLTGRFYLIEVNPRFTGWIYFSASLGSNQPYLAARLAMGEPVNAPDNERPIFFIRSRIEIPLRPSHVAALSTKGALHHA